MTIKELPKPKTASVEWVVEAIRGLLNMAITEEISDFSYTAIVGGEIREFGYRAKNSDIMACEECESDKFTLSQNGSAIDIICSGCKMPYGVIDPR